MMPHIEVLIALKDSIATAMTGRTLRGSPVGVRHYRHRNAREDDLPELAVRFISADVATGQNETTMRGTPELYMELAVNLVIETMLPAEEHDPASATGDPTGYGDPAQILKWALEELLPDVENGAEPNTLGGRAWEIRYDGTAPEEDDGVPDGIRIEERLAVLYRVRADRPTLLLRDTQT